MIREDCDWCGNDKDLSEHPFISQDGGVETICRRCLDGSYRCTICTDLSSLELFGVIADDQPKDTCNDCWTKVRDAIRVLEGMTCACGTPIDPMTAVTNYGLPCCENCGSMFDEYFKSEKEGF